MKTKAAVLNEMGLSAPYAESQPLAIEELDLEPPGEGEVLVRVGAAGLCHSDLSVMNGARPRPVPMAIGHEAAGIVREDREGPGRYRFDHAITRQILYDELSVPGRVRLHRGFMVGTYAGLLIAAGFALSEGRLAGDFVRGLAGP